jgi:hypothetical protein
MPPQSRKSFAFIDGQNLFLGLQEIGLTLDYRRFRSVLAGVLSLAAGAGERSAEAGGFAPVEAGVESFCSGMLKHPIIEC